MARKNNLSRRGRSVLAGFLLLGAALAGLGFWVFRWEPDQIELRQVTVELPGWPASHTPLRLAMLSDLHAGAPFIDADKIKAVVAKIEAEQPDLVLLLGDYVIHGVIGGEFMAPSEIAGALSGLSAPLGVYAVLGNHDWWSDASQIKTALSGVGIEFLDNQAKRIQRPGGDFWLLGIGDFWEGKPNVTRSLAAVSDS